MDTTSKKATPVSGLYPATAAAALASATEALGEEKEEEFLADIQNDDADVRYAAWSIADQMDPEVIPQLRHGNHIVEAFHIDPGDAGPLDEGEPLPDESPSPGPATPTSAAPTRGRTGCAPSTPRRSAASGRAAA